jgi:hypothetical protein
MKTKFYIGLVGDETQVPSLKKNCGSAFEAFLTVLLKHANVASIDALPFEPVLLTNSATNTELECCENADRLQITTEVVSPEIYQTNTTKNFNSDDEWLSFLINKSNLLLVIHSLDKAATTNTLSQNIVERVLQPETYLSEELNYFANNSEFLPYLYQVNLSDTGSQALGFARERESECFGTLLTNFNNISAELEAANAVHTNKALSAALPESETAHYSLNDFYKLSCQFDSLASKHQRKSNIGFWVLFSLTLVLGASFLLYAKVFTHSPWLLIVYLIAYSGGVFTFYKMNKTASLKKHLAYRLCAEALRLKLFQLVSFSESKVMAFQFEKMVSMSNIKTDWIAHIVRSAPLHQITDDSKLSERKDIILTHLVDDQLDYFTLKLKGKKNASSPQGHKPKLDGLEKWLHRFSFTSIFIVVFCVVLMIVVTLTAFKVGVFYNLYPIKNIMMFLIGFLPLVGLAFEQLVFNFALEENEMRYHHQISKFESIKRWMLAANSESTLSKVCNQLCIECAQENFNWYTTRVNRQHKPASGG